jgi:dethiobiotin synthetase
MAMIFVTATDTSVGKTYAVSSILKSLGNRGVLPGVCKPIETGVSGDAGEDTSKLFEICSRYNRRFSSMTPEDICIYSFSLPSAPFCADTERVIDIDELLVGISSLESSCDLLVVEGAGGLMVPITEDFFMIDLIESLDTPALLVTPSKLGCINQTLLSIEAMERRGIDYEWCVNIYEDSDSFDMVTRPFYDRVFPSWWSLENGLECYIDTRLEAISLSTPPVTDG